VLLALVAGGAPVAARPVDEGVFHQLVRAATARVAPASSAPVPVPPPPVTPPRAVAATWRAQRIASLDLGAPVLALVAGDADGDGHDELYALTTGAVVALAVGEHHVRELGRVGLVGAPAAAPSRDVVGALRVEGGEVIAATSAYAHGMRLRWRGGALAGVEDGEALGFCSGEAIARAPGRNVFGVGPAALLAVRCRADLVDADGHALKARGELGLTGKLEVELSRCEAGHACVAAGHHAVTGVGVAFEIADVDRDGHPEVIAAAAGAPGDPDAVRVVTLGQDERKPRFKRAFTGGIAGVAALDLDRGAALVVVAAVRLVGAGRIDLWRFD
jgi:hypothetical protein